MLVTIERQIKKFVQRRSRANKTEPASVRYELVCRRKATKKGITKRGRLLILPNDQKFRPFEQPKVREVAVSMGTFQKPLPTPVCTMSPLAEFVGSFFSDDVCYMMYKDANGWYAFKQEAMSPCGMPPKDKSAFVLLNSTADEDIELLAKVCQEKAKVKAIDFIGHYNTKHQLASLVTKQ